MNVSYGGSSVLCVVDIELFAIDQFDQGLNHADQLASRMGRNPSSQIKPRNLDHDMAVCLHG